MRNSKKFEVLLLATALVSGITALKYPILDSTSLLVDLLVFLFFVNEFPSIFNRYFRTKIFIENKKLRFSFIGSFLILYAVFSYYLPAIFIPFSSVDETGANMLPQVFDVFFPSLLAIFLVAFLISIEIRRYPLIVNMFFRRIGSKEEILRDSYQMEKSRIAHLFGIFIVGLAIEGMAVFLMGFWFVSFLFSPLFLLLTTLWLVYDLIYAKKFRPISRISKGLSESDDNIETAIGWKGFLKPILSGTGGMSIALLEFFAYGIFSLLLVIFVPNFMPIFWVFSGCWYLLIILVCLTIRLSNEVYLLRDKTRRVLSIPLPPKANLVLLLMSTNIFVLSFLTALPISVNDLSRITFYILSIFTNVVGSFQFYCL